MFHYFSGSVCIRLHVYELIFMQLSSLKCSSNETKPFILCLCTTLSMDTTRLDSITEKMKLWSQKLKVWLYAMSLHVYKF